MINFKDLNLKLDLDIDQCLLHDKESFSYTKEQKKCLKQYRLCPIRLRQIQKEQFGESFELLQAVTDTNALIQEMRQVLQDGGKVFGYRKNKKLVAVYLFTLHKDYFKDFYPIDINQNSSDDAKKDQETMRRIFGNTKDALVLHRCEILPEAEEFRFSMENEIFSYLTDSIMYDVYCGIEWNGAVYYRKFMKTRSLKQFFATRFGIFLCWSLLGWLLFDNLLSAVCMGISLALLIGLSMEAAGAPVIREPIKGEE